VLPIYTCIKYIYLYTCMYIYTGRERERDNVVYWKTNRKIINDLQLHGYMYTYICAHIHKFGVYAKFI